MNEDSLRKKRRALTDAEIDKFLGAAHLVDEERARFHAAEKTIGGKTKGRSYAELPRRPPVPQAILWKCLILTGLRWHEAATLRWADVNEQARYFVVRAEIAKNKTSRSVPFPTEHVQDLDDVKEANASATGRSPVPGDLVFLSPLGCPWENRAGGMR